MVDKQSTLWRYLSGPQKDLIQQGFYLLEDTGTHTPIHPVSDYSYLVFPFAKAYEGFLKQLFLDLQLIKKWQYENDHFRIGKILSPEMAKTLRRNSIYTQLTNRLGSSEIPDELWNTWKQGRNLIFHYFPHNIKAITLPQAEELIEEFIRVMQLAVDVCHAVEA